MNDLFSPDRNEAINGESKTVAQSRAVTRVRTCVDRAEFAAEQLKKPALTRGRQNERDNPKASVALSLCWHHVDQVLMQLHQ